MSTAVEDGYDEDRLGGGRVHRQLARAGKDTAMSTGFYRQLSPTSGLRVSPLSLGAITFGGSHGMEHFGHVGVDEAVELLSAVQTAGVNMVDVVNYYSTGQAEEILGDALTRSRDFDALLVTSKVRMVVGDGPNDGGQSRWHILDQVDRSLRRLRRDHLDLYYLHEWDGQTPLEESLRTMGSLIRAGKIRYYGVSNFTSWQLMKVLMVCDAHGLVRPVTQQIYYTPQARDAEYEMIPAAIDQGIGTNVWSPLAMGLLTGKYRRDRRPEHGRMVDGDGTDVRINDWGNLYDLVDVLDEVATAHGMSIPAVVLAWLLTRPGVTNVVVGARSTRQLSESLQALNLTLTGDEIAAIEQVSRPPVRCPFWHQADLASDRLSPADEGIVAATAAQL